MITFTKVKLRGFTLIELLVTLAIFTVMTGLVLANYPDFNKKVSRDLLAQNIALSIREAQVYGTSIRSDAISAGADTSNAFGVFFGTDQRGYYLFTDRPVASGNTVSGDKIFSTADLTRCPPYTAQEGEVLSECISKYIIAEGKNRILLACGNYHYSDSNGDSKTRADCDGAAMNTNLLGKTNIALELNVLFQRPNPEAIITGKGFRAGFNCGSAGDDHGIVNATDSTLCDYTNAAIFIGDGISPAKKVIIWNTGQIATE